MPRTSRKWRFGRKRTRVKIVGRSTKSNRWGLGPDSEPTELDQQQNARLIRQALKWVESP